MDHWLRSVAQTKAQGGADRHTYGTASWRQLPWQPRSCTHVNTRKRRLEIASVRRGTFRCIYVRLWVFLKVLLVAHTEHACYTVKIAWFHRAAYK